MAKTKTQALDHLIDVLAGENIETKGTVATVIDTLADLIEDGTIVIGGGGGGGGDATSITFEQALDMSGEEAVYTLTNAEAVMDAFLAIVSAEDIPAEILKYRVAFGDDGTSYEELFFSVSIEDSVRICWLNPVGDGSGPNIYSMQSGGEATCYCNLTNLPISESDIDSETGVLTITFDNK